MTWFKASSHTANLRDMIIAVVKESLPNIFVYQSEVVRVVVVRINQELLRHNGYIIRFKQNAAVLINKEGNPRGSRVFGTIAREVRYNNFMKIISLAPEIILNKTYIHRNLCGLI